MSSCCMFEDMQIPIRRAPHLHHTVALGAVIEPSQLGGRTGNDTTLLTVLYTSKSLA